MSVVFKSKNIDFLWILRVAMYEALVGDGRTARMRAKFALVSCCNRITTMRKTGVELAEEEEGVDHRPRRRSPSLRRWEPK